MAEGKKISELTDATVVNLTDTFPIVQSGSTLEAAVELLANAIFPVGCVADYAGASAPTGWFVCDGTAVSRTTYAGLFAAIGTTWGVGDGSTTFNLPDLRGAFVRGTGSHGTETMANGSPYTGPAVGAFEDDQFQGHWHNFQVTSTSTNGTLGLSGAGLYNPLAPSNNDILEPITDGANGTPRTGPETKPFAAGVTKIIKAF